MRSMAERGGKHDDVTRKIVGVFYEVYNELGYGFLESVYCQAMRLALTQNGLQVETEVPVPVSFRDGVIGIFRDDLIVNGAVLIELKALDGLLQQHKAQTLHYLRATEIKVALLMNFGAVPRLKRLMVDKEAKRASHQSVVIGAKPLSAPEVIE